MRLDSSQVARILKIVAEHAGSDSRVSVYGSRLDDRARGGDIDLFIETAAPMPRWEQARMLAALEDELGLPVDILVKCVHAPDTPFESMARSRAVVLNQAEQ
ncbi:Nucleotidyltransferase domain-containing protein [Desulfonatronum thiosulfatophilum]|uniref:Nucleotidyltransferase domain-containing protein n=1 Tax=Desulfonatronum thiosulfatophilum TaxID=617002 RepID=A0A1G6DSB9_9BACT|nr:nucleotidyltransferase domain-containing protein [Desulfonatronum thiosulfatophilum]SDB48107.1 Nucleotidyltransferase domain-containing protein [Desulfonatronum thiosulfatophilum]